MFPGCGPRPAVLARRLVLLRPRGTGQRGSPGGTAHGSLECATKPIPHPATIQGCGSLGTTPTYKFSYKIAHSLKQGKLVSFQGAQQVTSGSARRPRLLLHVDHDQAQNSHESEGLQAEEPQQRPEEQHHHRLHRPLPEVHPGEAHAEEASVQLPEQRPHPLVVVPERGARVALCFLDILREQGSKTRRDVNTTGGRAGQPAGRSFVSLGDAAPL